MDMLKNILNNQWVINIGTGIIVAIITWLASNVIFKKITKKDLNENINDSNREIIKTLKPYITEDDIIDNLLLNSIRNSVARRFDCKPVNLYNDIEICEELIKEILDEDFLPIDEKRKYICKLNIIILKSEKAIIEQEIVKLENENTYDINFQKRRSIYTKTSMLLISAVIVMYSVLIAKESLYMGYYKNRFMLIITFAITIYIMLIIAYVLFLKRRRNKRKKHF